MCNKEAEKSAMSEQLKDDYPYDATVDESMGQSMQKALEIYSEQSKEFERRREERIVRPEMNIKNGLFLMTIILILLFFLLPCVLYFMGFSRLLIIVSTIAVSIVVFAFNAQRVVVWLVRCYQKYAPIKLRLSCVFEPSCSEYMLIAIKKYGTIRGIGKGINRLFRCHYPNGGIDTP